jgi:putative ubiquitin-RnfH superfamily antitoxin RatB of RatAB toxin-antitoxin module
MIQVEVVGFDSDGKAHRAVVSLPLGATVADLCPVLEPTLQAIWQQASGFSVWGRLVTPNTAVRSGDRVALLSALKADPKEARRLRVEGARRANAEQGRFDRWTRSR